MKKEKRSGFFIIAFLGLVLCILAACKKGGTEYTPGPFRTVSGETIGTTTGQGGYKERGGNLAEFSMARPVWNNPTYQRGNPFEQALFQAGNVKINATFAKAEDYNQLLTTLFAGRTDIDVIWHDGRENNRKLMDEGAFQPIDEWLEKYPALKEVNFPHVWDMIKEPDGSTLYFPNPTDPFTNFPLIYRADLIEKAGIPLPATTDELIVFLTSIKQAYPNIVPLACFINRVEFLFTNLYNAFGNNHQWMYDASKDRLVHYITSPQYINSMAYMHDLRVRGLLDPDFMIADGLGADKFLAGNAAVVSAQWWWIASAANELRSIVPDAKVKVLPTLTGPDGDKSGAIASRGYDWGFSINAKTPKAKVDAIFEYLNWLYTDGYEINYKGFEGYHFTRNEDGTYQPMDGDKLDPAWDWPNAEPLQFPQKTYTLYPNWLEVYNNVVSMEFEGEGGNRQGVLTPFKTELVETIRASYEQGVVNANPDYDKSGYSATRSSIGGLILDQLVTAESRILIDPSANIQTLIDAQAKYMADGGQKIQDEVNANTPNKTVAKPEYHYTGPDYPRTITEPYR